MYEKRFGLHRKPFQSVLSDHDFYSSETFREILPGMLHALRSDLGVAVLTGPAGVGKSVTLDSIRRQLEADCQAVLIRGGTVHSAADLLFMLHRKLLKCQPGKQGTAATEPTDTVRRWEVVERLQRVAEFWGPLVVLLDDAHLVEPKVFGELRALLEEEFSGQKLLRLLITGPLVLEEVLAEPVHGDFAQKIRTHVFLQPLKSSEAVQYLHHHISCAGGELSDVMDQPAIERIVAAADGVPRCLNLLADESMMVVEELNQNQVTRPAVDKALARLQHLPYSWNVSLYDDDDDDEDFPQENGHADSVVEIGSESAIEVGASAGGLEITPGVIEIGGPTAPQSVVSAVAASAVAAERTGVVEFGAPAIKVPSKVAAATEMATSSPSETCETAFETPATAEATVPSVELVEANGSVEESESVIEATDEFAATEINYAEMFSDTDGFVEISDADSGDEQVTETDDRYANEALLNALLDGVESSENETEADEVALLGDDLDEENVECLEQDLSVEEISSPDANLEHHLLLANTTNDVDALTLSNDETVTDELTNLSASADEMPFDDTCNDPDSDVDDVQLGAFLPWEPAGAWPAPPVDENPTAVAHTRQLERPNKRPIFDRYTWCELGRSVMPGQRVRLESTLTLSAPTVWPPVTDGIAPVDSISVAPVENDYAELLTDLDGLVEVTEEETIDVDAIISDLTEAPSEGSCNHTEFDSFYPLADGPENSLERIQDLIDIEQAEDNDPAGSNEDSSPPSAEQDSDSADGRLISDEPLPAIDNSEAEDLTSDPDEPWRTLPIDTNPISDDGISGEDSSGTYQDGLNDSNPEGDRSCDLEDDTERAVIHVVLRDDELLDEQRQVGDFVNDGEEEATQIYTPQLLRQARQRVVSRAAGGRRIRRAAGAESLSINSVKVHEDHVEPRLTISAETPETLDDEESSVNNVDGRFSSLFTRLRSLGKRSA